MSVIIISDNVDNNDKIDTDVDDDNNDDSE